MAGCSISTRNRIGGAVVVTIGKSDCARSDVGIDAVEGNRHGAGLQIPGGVHQSEIVVGIGRRVEHKAVACSAGSVGRDVGGRDADRYIAIGKRMKVGRAAAIRQDVNRYVAAEMVGKRNIGRGVGIETGDGEGDCALPCIVNGMAVGADRKIGADVGIGVDCDRERSRGVAGVAGEVGCLRCERIGALAQASRGEGERAGWTFRRSAHKHVVLEHLDR